MCQLHNALGIELSILTEEISEREKESIGCFVSIVDGLCHDVCLGGCDKAETGFRNREGHEE